MKNTCSIDTQTRTEVQKGHKQFNIKAPVTHKTGIQVTLVCYYPDTQAVLTLSKHFPTWAADITLILSIVSAAVGESVCAYVSGESNKRSTVSLHF